MFPRAFLLGLAVGLAVPATASAQICRGSAPLAGMWLANANGSVVFFDGGKTSSGGVTVGSSLFASGSFSRNEYNNPIGLHLDVVSGSLGYERALADTPVSFCPLVGIGYGYDYELLGVDLTTFTTSVGLGFGSKVEVEPNVFVVPGAELTLLRERHRLDDGVSGASTTHDTYGVLAVSLGFLMFRQRMSLAPIVQVPIAADGGSFSAGVSAVMSVGGGPN
ncbi:MAG: hypothetical protein FJ207_14870 [Gemmatimonadetes bacterium]|nr:hypothetical protein [Gemmatimonadota bacterium]